MMLALLAAAAAALCPLPPPAETRDAAGAAAFLEVGDGELAAGAADTAAAAYREALRLDPAAPRAKPAYLAACARAHKSEALALGRSLMDAGDRRGAIEIFERLRQGDGDAAASLLEGICLYEQAKDDDARPLLLEAQAAPDLAARASYFLGLIELREGLASDAAAHFAEASRDGALADRADLLLGTARRSGRAVLSFLAETGYDSNVNFSPDGTPASADAGGATGLSLSLRPYGISGPYLRGSGYYRGQLLTRDRDLGFFTGQAGFRAGRGDDYAFADYEFGATLLGGAPYLYQHRARAGARVLLQHLAFSAVYSARFGSYQPPPAVDRPSAVRYSGLLQTLEPEVSLRFPLGSNLALGYRASRDSTSYADTSSWEHGPRAALRLVLLPSLRASAEVGLSFRSFDAALDATLPTRVDRIFFAGAALEKDLLDRFTLRLSAGDRISSSNQPGYSYSRLTAVLALSYTLGLF